MYVPDQSNSKKVQRRFSSQVHSAAPGVKLACHRPRGRRSELVYVSRLRFLPCDPLADVAVTEGHGPLHAVEFEV